MPRGVRKTAPKKEAVVIDMPPPPLPDPEDSANPAFGDQAGVPVEPEEELPVERVQNKARGASKPYAKEESGPRYQCMNNNTGAPTGHPIFHSSARTWENEDVRCPECNSKTVQPFEE